jgi:Gas vesicle protein G
MFLLDDLLIGGLGFVFDKIAAVVDQEMNDEQGLHQTLLEAQMRLELGEITDAEFADIEAMVISRLRELRELRESRQRRGLGAGRSGALAWAARVVSCCQRCLDRGRAPAIRAGRASTSTAS